MFADIAKMVVKSSIAILAVGLIVALVSQIDIPASAVDNLSLALGKGIAIIRYWVPNYQQVYNFFVVMLGLETGVVLLRVGLIAYRIIFKINE